MSLYHIFPGFYKAKARELSTIVTTSGSPMTGTSYRLLFFPEHCQTEEKRLDKLQQKIYGLKII
ncbi:hypothetical protein BpHYR1_046178 [Brachionus plicatilis]|uniref:Uncharacterized protein n=1 Tax=Brachionus plicatilis TaxID=10195 RepID=A0A3M7S412_BRAPC|nr:hypothetical protein BpHYR1_046178 [Brachionus plicatilis]